MELTIRKADFDDVDAIAVFGTEVVPEHYTPILGQQGARAQLVWWTPEYISPAVEAGRVHVAINDVGGVVGVCQTGEADGKQVIWKLYVAPDYRGRSLGVELLRQAISALPEHADRVEVEHFAGNTRAARFYAREGFDVIRTDPATSERSPGNAIIWRRLQLP